MPYRPRSTDLWFNLAGVVAAYQPVAAPDPRAARMNVSHDARRAGVYAATDGVAPTWAGHTGWMFNGSTQYLDTSLWPSQIAQTNSVLVRYSSWTRSSYSMLLGTFFSESGTREFNIGKNGTYSIANHGILNVTLPTGGVVGFAGTAGYIDGVNVGTLNSPGVYTTGRLLLGAATYYNDGLAYYFATASIQAALIAERTLSPAEVALTSRQMAYCHVNPDWSVWERRRRYYYTEYVEPAAMADDIRSAAAGVGAFGPRLGGAARMGHQQAAELPAAARAGHRSRLNG